MHQTLKQIKHSGQIGEFQLLAEKDFCHRLKEHGKRDVCKSVDRFFGITTPAKLSEFQFSHFIIPNGKLDM